MTTHSKKTSSESTLQHRKRRTLPVKSPWRRHPRPKPAPPGILEHKPELARLWYGWRFDEETGRLWSANGWALMPNEIMNAWHWSTTYGYFHKARFDRLLAENDALRAEVARLSDVLAYAA